MKFIFLLGVGGGGSLKYTEKIEPVRFELQVPDLEIIVDLLGTWVYKSGMGRHISHQASLI